MSSTHPSLPARIPTGVPGLDEVLRGGLPAGRSYVVRGRSGSGKTTLGLQYVIEGAKRDEPVLYVILTETRDELHEVVASHGWSLEGVHVHEVVERPDAIMEEAQSTIFGPSELELGDTVQEIMEMARRVRPTRVVIDPLTELRLMADDPLRFRRQFLALKQVFADMGATAIFIEESAGQSDTGEHLENVAHGVLLLDQQCPTYGPDRRQMRVMKVRGLRYIGGHHDVEIVSGGMRVHPRPMDLVRPKEPGFEVVSTDLSRLDRMLGGGLERGITLLVTGQAGTGKSSVITHMVEAIVKKGTTGALYLFEERPALLRRRAEGLGISLDGYLDEGRLLLRQIDPGEMSPGHLIHQVLDLVSNRGVGVLALDSLGGLSKTMYDEPLLDVRLREMLAWLSRRGVITLLSMQTKDVNPLGRDISYLTDTVVFLEYVLKKGRMGKSISVLKRRAGEHDSTARELLFTRRGLVIGDALCERMDSRGVPRPYSSPSYSVRPGPHAPSKKARHEGETKEKGDGQRT